eukprot:3695221-Rhodomonas_salina.1
MMIIEGESARSRCIWPGGMGRSRVKAIKDSGEERRRKETRRDEERRGEERRGEERRGEKRRDKTASSSCTCAPRRAATAAKASGN